MYASRTLGSTLGPLDRWISWRLTSTASGKKTKKPSCSTKQGPWRSLKDVLADVTPSDTEGIGLVLTGGIEVDGAQVFALDLDGCRNPQTGEIDGWADEVLEHFDTYAEVSPSGTGLRLIGLADSVPRMPVIDVPGEAHGDHERRQIQVFGYGVPSYVTITGKQVPDSPKGLRRCTDAFGWLRYQYPSAEPVDVPELDVKPVGRKPTVEELDSVVRAHATPEEIALIDGGKFDEAGMPSASEGWFVLVRLVLAHCAGHVDVATRWLLTSTAYGRGDVEDSRDPAKYMRESWVRGDLARVWAKQRADVDEMFDPIATNGTPPVTHQPQVTIYDRMVAETFEVLEDEPAATTDVGNEFFESVSALMARDPSPKWLVKGVLEQDTLGAISGAAGSLKTFLAIDLGLSIATNIPWHGHRVESAPVLYLAGEGHGGLSRRMRAWFEEHEIDPAGVPFAVSRHAAQFLDEKGFLDVERHIGDMAKRWKRYPKLIVIDTLNRNFGPGDENSTADMTQFLARCERLRHRLAGCTVLLIHHTGWGDKTRARGSSVLGATVDCDMIVTREVDKHTGLPNRYSRLNWRKMKDAPEPAPAWMDTAVKRVGTDEDGDAVTSLVVTNVSDTRPVRDGAVVSDPQAEQELHSVLEMYRADPSLTKAEALETCELSRRRWQTAVDVAEQHGLLRIEGTTRDKQHFVTPAGLAYLSGETTGFEIITDEEETP